MDNASSYGNRDGRWSNRGPGLDHVWATHVLGVTLRGHTILRDARDWTRGSDHVPVVVEHGYWGAP